MLASDEQAIDYYKAYTAILKLFTATDPMHLDHHKGWYKTYAHHALQLLTLLPEAKTEDNILFGMKCIMGNELQLPYRKMVLLAKEVYAIRDLYIWPPEAY